MKLKKHSIIAIFSGLIAILFGIFSIAFFSLYYDEEQLEDLILGVIFLFLFIIVGIKTFSAIKFGIRTPTSTDYRTTPVTKSPAISLPPIITPRTKIPMIPFYLPLRRKKKKKKRKGRKAYSVFEKRFGEFKLIGTGLPIGRAKRKGVKRVRSTLGATFRLKPTGKMTSMSDVKFNISPRIFKKLGLVLPIIMPSFICSS